METATTSEPSTYLIPVEDAERGAYLGRVTGWLIAESADVSVYRTDDGRVLVNDLGRVCVEELANPETDLRGWLDHDDEAYVEAMDALCLPVVIDL